MQTAPNGRPRVAVALRESDDGPGDRDGGGDRPAVGDVRGDAGDVADAQEIHPAAWKKRWCIVMFRITVMFCGYVRTANVRRLRANYYWFILKLTL